MQQPMASKRSSIKWLFSQIPGWEQKGWISAEGAKCIRDAYMHELSPDVVQRRVFAVIAVLGAALIGGGIILLVAYNWQLFGRGARVVLSFLPLLISQAIGLYVLFRKYDSAAWREAGAMGIVAAVAAAIALIGQTYNIQGNLPGFLMTWLLLSLPVVLVLRARMCSFILIGQFLFWVAEVKDVGIFAYQAWILLAPCLFVVAWLQVRERKDVAVLNVLCGIGITACLFSSLRDLRDDSFLLLAIPWLATVHYIGYRYSRLASGKALLWIARIILLMQLFSYTFDEVWKGIGSSWQADEPTWFAGDMLVIGAFQLIAVVILVRMWHAYVAIRFVYLAPLLTVACWALSQYGMPEIAAGAVSLYAIGLGLALILPAMESRQSGRIQLGVGVICITLLLKFFDYDMSLLTRGIAFIVTGGGFLVLNYFLSKRGKGGDN